MQAIAHVNRVYKDKQGGLIADYLGLAYRQQEALAAYTDSSHPADTAIDQDIVVAQMQKFYVICQGIFHGFDWSKWTSGSPRNRLSLLPRAQEFTLRQPDGKNRLLKAARKLSLAFALALPDDRALAVRAALVKSTVDGDPFREDIEQGMRQLLSRALATDKVIDILPQQTSRSPRSPFSPKLSRRK